MGLEYVFEKGETYEIKSTPRMLAERFIAYIEGEVKATLSVNKSAGYLAQFVIADNYKLSEPTAYSRFDKYDFSIYDNTIDMKSSLYDIPSLIVEKNKLYDADILLLFKVGNTHVTCLGGITLKRILENQESFKLQLLGDKLVYIIDSKELVNIKIDSNGVEEYG